MNKLCSKEIKDSQDCPFPVKNCSICCDIDFSMYGEIIRYSTAACREQYLLKQRIINSRLNAFEREELVKAVIDQVDSFISTWGQTSVSVIIPDHKQQRAFTNHLTMRLCSDGFEVLRVRESEMRLLFKKIQGMDFNEKNSTCKEWSLLWQWKSVPVLLIQGYVEGRGIPWRPEILQDILLHRDTHNLSTVLIIAEKGNKLKQ